MQVHSDSGVSKVTPTCCSMMSSMWPEFKSTTSQSLSATGST